MPDHLWCEFLLPAAHRRSGSPRGRDAGGRVCELVSAARRSGVTVFGGIARQRSAFYLLAASRYRPVFGAVVRHPGLSLGLHPLCDLEPLT